jgi:polyhydroxybutyrate depolymerase
MRARLRPAPEGQGPQISLLIVVLSASGCAKAACGDGETTCEVQGGSYLARLPPGEAEGPLPLVLLLHGYSSSAEGILDKADLAEVFGAAGFLMVAPSGIDATWVLPGSPEAEDGGGRDDMAFLDAVVADVEDRWRVGPRLLGGFSHGSAAANVYACGGSTPWDALLSVSGTFWEPMPARCEAALPVRHSHGTADQTWPPEGRRFSPTVKQGDVWEGMAVWAATAGCAAAPVEERRGPTTCAVWPGCALALCQHDGVHEWPEGEADRQLAWFEALPPG